MADNLTKKPVFCPRCQCETRIQAKGMQDKDTQDEAGPKRQRREYWRAYNEEMRTCRAEMKEYWVRRKDWERRIEEYMREKGVDEDIARLDAVMSVE